MRGRSLPDAPALASGALAIERLSSGYGETMVINGVSLRVGQGEIVALLGKNGMGKSTLLRTVLGFLPARAGSVKVLGQEATGAAPDALVRRGVAYAPQ